MMLGRFSMGLLFSPCRALLTGTYSRGIAEMPIPKLCPDARNGSERVNPDGTRNSDGRGYEREQVNSASSDIRSLPLGMGMNGF